MIWLDETTRAPVTTDQLKVLTGWERGAAVASMDGLWQLWLNSVSRFGDSPAVREGTRQLTYRELHQLVELQADLLVAAGVGPDEVVGITSSRGASELVAVLAALALGAAYVALDPSLPPERLRTMVELVRPTAVIGSFDQARKVVSLAPSSCRAVAAVSTTRERSSSKAHIGPAAEPGRIAYIAFTSGSTGRPKAVRIPASAVVRLVRGATYLRSGPGERMLRLAPLAFDASTLEIFVPLLTGGTVEVYPPTPVTPLDLASFFVAHDITVAWLTAGLFRLVVEDAVHGFAGIRQIVTGGDVVPAEHVRRVLSRCPDLTVINGYGPTENTTFSTVHVMTSAAAVPDHVPIGRPVGGTSVVVVGPDGRRVAIGEVGELWVCGAGLALDYLADPVATEREFVIFQDDGERYYRTGDLVRWNVDGTLQFIGRGDRQVKVRGYRIELAEIEFRLRSAPEVRDAAVTVVGSTATDKRILAAVVADPGAGLTSRLRNYLEESLPDYMIPQLWTVVPRLPITANGKIDADHLAAAAVSTLSEATIPEAANRPEPAETARVADVSGQVLAERSPILEIVFDAWRKVLGTDSFGLDDRFFEVGGDSFKAARLHTILRAKLPDRTIRVVDIFRFPTVNQLAAYLNGEGPRA